MANFNLELILEENEAYRLEAEATKRALTTLRSNWLTKADIIRDTEPMMTTPEWVIAEEMMNTIAGCAEELHTIIKGRATQEGGIA